MEKKKCPYCGSYDLTLQADGTYKCNDCGMTIKPELKDQTSNITSNLVGSSAQGVDNVMKGKKNRFIAAALAFFFGYLGAQYFYLGEMKKGFICLAIDITLIGIGLTYLWGIIFAIRMIATDADEFDAKYNKK